MVMKNKSAINELTIRKLYDSIAKNFDAHRNISPNQWDMVEWPEVKKLIGNLNGKTVLDAGCGTGIFISKILPSGTKKIVGIDLSEKMLDYARKRSKQSPNVELIHGSIKKIPYPDNYFDLVVSFNVFQYVEKLDKVLTELYRVLNNKRHMVFSIRHPIRNLAYMAETGRGNYFEKGWHKEKWDGTGGKEVYSFYRPLSEWINMLICVGFRIKLLIEPKPAASIRIKYSDFYNKYTRIPRGLIIIVEK
jgi:ubiquinone/menaquinone biosynthesis C-methylase UbiE